MLTQLHPVIADVPSRLSPATVELAGRYLDGEFLPTMAEAAFRLPESAAEQSDNMKYALAVRLIAAEAPLRIVPGEKLVGAATLLEAARHRTPGCSYPGTSHVTVGFGAVLRCGYRELRRRIETRLTDATLTPDRCDFLHSMLVCLEGAEIWRRRYADELDRLAAEGGPSASHYRELRVCLERVPEAPPETFREAVQSLWLMFSFQRLCGNWSGLGRIDEMLGPWLERDLADGRITLDEARELLAHFWIKGTEWKGATVRDSGDAQEYQNVILGGIDRDGRDVTNAVTDLVLDVVEELHISEFPVAVRVNGRTPERLWRRVAEVQRYGGGIVSIYHEDLVIRALTQFGFPPEEARCFTNDGCWEVIIGGKSAFTYLPFDALQLLQQSLGLDRDDGGADYAGFEELYRDFLVRLETFCRDQDRAAGRCFRHEHRNGDQPSPVPLLSLFVDDCIERARSYNDRGARYSIAAIHAGGLPDVANSLYVIKKLVYEERCLSLPELVAMLRRDWAGDEPLRQRIGREYPLYGNDAEEADAMLAAVVADYARIAGQVRTADGVLRPVGISTFGREIAYAPQRRATAFGRRAGEFLATNLAPTPGSDDHGPTAVVKSFCRVDFARIPNGCPLELKLHPASVRGEAGLDGMVGLLKTFVALGGGYLQIDVVDNRILRDAQLHPDRYPNLAVRISGWSARFNTLDRRWQDMIINRTQQNL